MVICSKLLCTFHGVLLVFCQSSSPQGSLRGDFSLGQKPASFAPPAPALHLFLPRDRRRKLTQSALAQRPRPSVIWSETDPLFGSPVPVQEPRICRHSSAHYPPDVRPINGSPFHSASGHPGCRSLLHWARCSPQSSMALSFRTDSSEMRGRSVSCDGRNKISS